MTQPRFCAACGRALAGARYCGSCGADVTTYGEKLGSDFDTDAVIDWLLVGLSGVTNATDFQRTSHDRLLIHSERVEWWAVLIAIFAFPIGLLALLIKERMACEIRVFVDDAGRPQLAVAGSANSALRSRLKKLGREFYRHYAAELPAAPAPA